MFEIILRFVDNHRFQSMAREAVGQLCHSYCPCRSVAYEKSLEWTKDTELSRRLCRRAFLFSPFMLTL